MQVDMSKILYNERVMGDLDYYENHDDELAVYDDSGEWYNQYTDDIYASEADV
jgi:hypothetical protein